MHSFTKSRDSRTLDLTATAGARTALQKSAGVSFDKDHGEKKIEQLAVTESRAPVEKSDADTQTPDLLPRAPWLAGPGPIDCHILRLPNTELFAHRVTFCIQRHGVRTTDISITSQLEVAPCLETLRRARDSLYAVIVDDKTQSEELIGVQFLIKKDTVLRFVEYKEAVHQIGEDFSKVKDSAWNRQRIMKFFLDPMIDAIEPNLEDFNYFKSYLKRGLRS